MNIYKIKKPISKEKILKNIDHFLAYIVYISGLKSKNPDLLLEEFFPYGFTIILDHWKEFILQYYTETELMESYPDIALFDLLKDEFRFIRNVKTLSIDNF